LPPLQLRLVPDQLPAASIVIVLCATALLRTPDEVCSAVVYGTFGS
jgi:hypothetical protein